MSSSMVRVIIWPGRLKTWQPFYDDLTTHEPQPAPVAGDVLLGPFDTGGNMINGTRESLWLVRGRLLWTNAPLMERR